MVGPVKHLLAFCKLPTDYLLVFYVHYLWPACLPDNVWQILAFICCFSDHPVLFLPTE